MNTQADKARRMLSALDQLSAEYEGRPDVQHAVGEFLTGVGPSQLALLYDLVCNSETREAALKTIAGNYVPG